METISQVVEYVESHLRRMSSNALSDGEMLNILAGDGGVQVDVVFYMVSNSECLAASLKIIQIKLRSDLQLL
jgi:hypothetical protein